MKARGLCKSVCTTMRLYFVGIVAALLFAALSGAPLSYDGSYVLFSVLDKHEAYTPHNRLLHILLQSPVLAASSFTADLAMLRMIFGLSYAVIPFLSLLVSWWIVRAHCRPLFVWPSLAIGLGTLPAQFVFISEAMMVTQLAWPIVLSILTPLSSFNIIVTLLFSIAIFFAHPYAIVILAFCWGLAAFKYISPKGRSLITLVLIVFLAGLAMLRYLMLEQGYETERISLQTLYTSLRSSVYGLPLVALLLVWFAAALIFLGPTLDRPFYRRFIGALRFAQLVVVIAAGFVLLMWAREVRLLALTLGFRFWLLIGAAPFLVCGAIEGFRSGGDFGSNLGDEWLSRVRIVRVSGVVFLLVVAAQSTLWFDLTERLKQTLAQSPYPCVSRQAIEWLDKTPLNHWSITSYSVVLQGKVPRTLVLNEDWCAEARLSRTVRVADWDVREAGKGWFELKGAPAPRDVSSRCWFTVSSAWRRVLPSGADWWYWPAERGRVRLFVERDAVAAIRGALDSTQRPRKVDIAVNGRTETTVDLTRGGSGSFEVPAFPVKAGENVIEFLPSGPTEVLASSSWHGVTVRSLSVASGDSASACELQP